MRRSIFPSEIQGFGPHLHLHGARRLYVFKQAQNLLR